MPATSVTGVDGCPGGWVAAVLDGDDAVTWHVVPDAAGLLALPTGALAVDIPVGLPEAGARACDVQARRLLGPRRSSVFPAPVRAVLGSADYAEACARSRAAHGRALSLQAWHLLPRIADVDAAPVDHARLVECHPEVVLLRLAGPLPPKRTAEGARLREEALRRWLPGGWPPPPRPARRDDALDALACAWTARRWAAGTADVLGDEVDATGTPMRIVV